MAIKHLRIGAKDEFDKVFKVCCVWLGTSPSLSSNPATLPGGSHLETLISPKPLAPAGGFCIREPPVFPHRFRVDAQRERGGIHKIQSRGQPLVFGESAVHPLRGFRFTPLNDRPTAFGGGIWCGLPSRTRDRAR